MSVYLFRIGGSDETPPSNPLGTSMPATLIPKWLDNRPIHLNSKSGEVDNKQRRMRAISEILKRNYFSRHNPNTELRYLRENNDRLLAHLIESIKTIDQNIPSRATKVTASYLPKPIASMRPSYGKIRDWKRSPRTTTLYLADTRGANYEEI